MIKIIQCRKYWYAISSILFIVSVAALFTWGLKLGIDFTGGTLMELSFNNQSLDSQEIKDAFKTVGIEDISVQFSDNNHVLLRFKDIDEETHQKILAALNSVFFKKIPPAVAQEAPKMEVANDVAATVTATPVMDVDTTNPTDTTANSAETVTTQSISPNNGSSSQYINEKRFDSVGPVIGNELKSSAFWAILIALAGMILYIAWAFRKVSRPISSFSYGIIADIALFHDVIITLGVFSILGHFYNVEVGITFLAAILTILGYSINDTIVVFDRTRENLIKSDINDFEQVVNKSVNETLARSLNTSFTVLLSLSALYLFGGETIKYFIVALLVGIFFGTYSSIFIASPLLVTWQKWKMQNQK